MKPKTPTGFYRRVLTEAWSLVWQRRSLWVFGLFGGLLLSGAAIEPAAAGLSRAARMGNFWFSAQAGNWAVHMPMGRALADACRLDPTVAQAGLTVLTLLGFAAIAFVFMCQGGLIAGLLEKKAITVREGLKRGWAMAWELFVLNALSQAFQAILLVLAALPLFLFLQVGQVNAIFPSAIAILLYLPLSTAGHAIALFAAIHAVRRQTNVPASLEAGVAIFRRHWLAVFETAAILLLCGGGAILILGVALSLAAVPAILAFAVALSSGWFLGLGLVGACALLAFCAALFVFIGALTAFRYAVWVRFHESASHPIKTHSVVAKTKRLFHPKHVE